MSDSLFASMALTSAGWASGVRLRIDGAHIADVEAGVTAGPGDRRCGIVIPGLPNAHSHAFQRALVGHTEARGPADRDDFWTWRSRMYALAARVDAARLRAVAAQAYAEMLAAGFTAVAEFHYLHREPGCTAPSTAMFEAVMAAAQASGIRLTYVPVLYERAGFDEPAPRAEQRGFVQALDEFIGHYERAREMAAGRFVVGIGVHSLRAASPQSLAAVAAVAARDGVPLHLHVAEQAREVSDCVAVTGLRPVAWLLEHCPPTDRWCLVHATHIDADELASLAGTGATVCLCPSTEANLGDGLFPLQEWLAHDGRIAIGSDSHVSIDPFEELRWLEYGQRLREQTRNVAAGRGGQTGRSLFDAAFAGGHAACGTAGAGLAPGGLADLVVLDDQSPVLAGHDARSLLDALVFSGFTLPIERVMVAGRWQVIDGRHRDATALAAGYRDTVAGLDLYGTPP